VDHSLNNLWAICGPPVDCSVEYRIVETTWLLMHQVASTEVPFYRNRFLALTKS
jgi:hypothetical protein